MSALLIMRLFQEEGSVKEVLDNGLTYEKIVTAATENYEEYYYKIRNNTDSDIFFDKFVMFECDSLENLGLPTLLPRFPLFRCKQNCWDLLPL